MTNADAKLLQNAVLAAIEGEWDQAHHMVQPYGDKYACWIHAVLHKIEGDESNSRYWYARTDVRYEEFAEPQEELRVIFDRLGA